MTCTTMAPALRALLESVIDYAGLYPPAKLPLDTAISNYSSYRNGEYAWLLRWFVVSADEALKVPESMSGSLAVLGQLDDTRAASLETSTVITAQRPVYCEVSLDNLQALDKVKESGCFAKIRTGGLKPEAIPTPSAVADFIRACAALRLPFKATAGLHHPIRNIYPLTYEANAPRATMHGFLNVLMAAAFAWHGEHQLEPILAETDPNNFSFDSCAHWRNRSLNLEEIREARLDFIHAIGSCSFDEPVQDLKKLGLLPVIQQINEVR